MASAGQCLHEHHLGVEGFSVVVLSMEQTLSSLMSTQQVLCSMAMQLPYAVAQKPFELCVASLSTPLIQSRPPDQLSVRQAYLLNWLPSNMPACHIPPPSQNGTTGTFNFLQLVPLLFGVMGVRVEEADPWSAGFSPSSLSGTAVPPPQAFHPRLRCFFSSTSAGC
ncbi:UNVERIFIED_CONTAM: hypothetical protein FKN15_065615 [Acipenser sinensis]